MNESVQKRLQHWLDRRSPCVPLAEDIAIKRLRDARVSPDDQASKLSCLRFNGGDAPARVLASYVDLHALNRIDEAGLGQWDTTDWVGRVGCAILRAGEVALLNLTELSERVSIDVNNSDWHGAAEKYRWASSLHETMYSLSSLLHHLPGTKNHFRVSLKESAHFEGYVTASRFLHSSFNQSGLLTPSELDSVGLGSPSRSLTHQAFVDLNYEKLWSRSFSDVPVLLLEDTVDVEYDFATFEYKRLIGTDALFLAVFELDQPGDNFLRQFRAYHQISEILVAQVNDALAFAIASINESNAALDVAVRRVDIALEMMKIVVDNIMPISRNLCVKQYQRIRGSLGITSGSHSPNIRRDLFLTLYGLFIESVIQKVRRLYPDADVELESALAAFISSRSGNSEQALLTILLKQSLSLHLYLKSWRELHFQFVKSQIGFASPRETPTASISGSPNAIQAAYGMINRAHGARDPIAPIYRALRGTEYCGIGEVGVEFPDSSNCDFLHIMLSNTAKVVKMRSATVQKRVHESP